MPELPPNETPGVLTPELLERVREGQRLSWERGDRVPAEAILARHPEVAADPEAALDVIFNEVLCREARGEVVELEEYQRRFPRFHPELEAHFGIHRAIGPGPETWPSAAPGPTAGRGPRDAALPAVPGYEILEVLGRGGMGVVFKARQVELDRVVALKMISAGSLADPEWAARFRGEALAAARLRHPNIVQVYEVGEAQGRPFFSLEYCPGGSLDRRLAAGPLPPDEAARLLNVLALAVDAAHQHNVIHRDLKPANILLAPASGRDSELSRPEAGANWVPKVTDFGLARRLDEVGRTHSGAVVGSPPYMAPEQARGQAGDASPSLDVYSLGAVLYECLTARPPFHGATVMDTLEQVCTRDPVPPRRLQPKVPRDLETICLKCLDKEPRRRYATAQELADDLRRFLGGEPIRARPVSVITRGWKWARRRPAVAALLLATILTALIGAGLVTWAWGEAVAARLRQEYEQGEKIAAQNRAEELRRADGLAAVQFAWRQWQENDVAGTLRALDDCPRDLRHWDWNYVRRRCRDDVLTLRADPDSVNVVAFSPDGAMLATGNGQVYRPGEKGEVRLWDAATGRELRSLVGHAGAVTHLVFMPDGKQVVSASAGLNHDKALAGDFRPEVGEVIFWDVATGEKLRTLPGYGSVAVGGDGPRVAAPGADGVVRVWDVKTGDELPPCPVRAVLVNSVGLSPDGNLLAVAYGEADPVRGIIKGGLKVWDVAAKKELWVVGTGESEVPSLDFSPDGKRLAVAMTGSPPGMIRDATTGARLAVLAGGAGGQSVKFSPDGGRVATGGKPALPAARGRGQRPGV